MNIGKEVAREWGAYRSVVQKSQEIYSAGLDRLPRALRWPLSAAARLFAEFDGVVIYPIERLKDRYSPEEIARRS